MFRRIAPALAAILLLVPIAGSGAEIRVLTAKDGLPSGWVTALAVAPGGKLWVGTGNAGVYLLDPATLAGKGYRAADGLASDEVASVALFQGKVYVGTSRGISVLEDARWSTIDAAGGVSLRNARLAASPDGKALWAAAVALTGGVVRFDGKEWKFMGGEGRGLFNDVQCFAFLPDGVLLGAGSGVPYQYRGTDVLPMGEGLPPAKVLSAGFWNGKAYLGTSRGLFVRDRTWREASVPREVKGSPVFSLAPGGDGLLAGTGVGLVKISRGQSSVVGVRDGLPGSRVLAVAAGEGYVAAGTANGLAIIRGWLGGHP